MSPTLVSVVSLMDPLQAIPSYFFTKQMQRLFSVALVTPHMICAPHKPFKYEAVCIVT